MSAVGLLVVGIVLLILGYNAPMPPPAPRICVIVGWCLFAVGLLFVVLGLIGVTAYSLP